MQLRCIYLQVAPADQRHELVPRVGLLESALHILLDDQACFMVSVYCFRAAGVNMMLPAEVHLEAVGLRYVPLPGPEIHMVFFRPLDAVVSVELLTQVASPVF